MDKKKKKRQKPKKQNRNETQSQTKRKSNCTLQFYFHVIKSAHEPPRVKISVTIIPWGSSFTQTQHLKNQQLNSPGEEGEELGVKPRKKRGVGVRWFKFFGFISYYHMLN